MHHKLESLRGIAACIIVLFHSPFTFQDKVIRFGSNSYLFVDFFFILSGFVMTLAYSERIRENLNFRSYLTLRLGRIYPLHIIMLLIWLPYIVIKQFLFESGFGGTDQFDTNNPLSFIANVFLVNSLGVNDYLSWNYPSWSLSAELFTYIVFYWLTVAIDNRKSVVIPLVISCISYGILSSLGRPRMDITFDYGFFRCLGAYYIGVFVYRISRLIREPRMIKRYLPAFEIFCVVGSAILVTYSDLDFLSFIPVIAIFAFSIYVFSRESSGFIGKLLLTNPFRKVGLWSYSIYMVHAIILAGFTNLFEYIFKWNIWAAMGVKSVALNILTLAIVIAVSKYSYTYIEKVFRIRSRKLARKYI